MKVPEISFSGKKNVFAVINQFVDGFPDVA
jgi:hypothetical protein